MALALYRKYRPRTFAEVIGQEHVTEPLSQALRSGRLHHAYLFSGPRGCGKTSSARILARSLNCVRGPTPDPCGECESCVALTTDAGSIDVIEIDAASHGGVDDARDLRERAFFAPATSRYKIYVIDEAHMVSSAGFNALLKLVEEPPEYVKFIFATTEPEKVLPTIKSRTHHYPFRLIPPGVLRPYLERLCEQEGVAVEPAVFPLVVRAGGGSARDTLSVLDQLISGAGPEGVSYARAAALLGVTDAALIDEMCDALAAADGAAAFATIDRVAEAGHDPRRFASDLLERLRDLIVLQQVPDAVDKGLLDAPSDQLARMAAQARQMGPATLSRCADIVHNGLVEMRGTTAPRLLLELICARMLLPGADDSTGGLLQRLERMERRLTLSGEPAPLAAAGSAVAPADSGVRAQPAPAAAPAAATASAAAAASAGAPQSALASAPPTVPESSGPAATSGEPSAPAGSATSPPPAASAGPATPTGPAAPAAPGALDAAAVRRVWDEILDMVGRRSKRVAALLREATVRDVQGDVLVLVFKTGTLAEMFSASPELLLDAMHEVLGGVWQVRCEVGGDQRSAGGGGHPRAANPSRAGGARGSGTGPRGGSSDAGTTNGRTGTGAVAPAPADSDWPEPALPGGAQRSQPKTAPGATGQTTIGAGAGAGAASGATAGSGSMARSGAGSGAARSAPGGRRGKDAAGPVSNDRVAGRNGPAGQDRPIGNVRPNGQDRADTDGWEGEPPYDPDYDGPARTAAAYPPAPTYEGFDPGDEPLDEVVDEQTVRQTSEQQALQLIQQALGAEKIGEI